ncbi:hypothetical protein QTI66_22010 [Variovorax sp. J22R133]|uniref:hypothetical protein n=1 Tax=Variovorax brevis TaxID=3053503 RepID=UPI00257559ED|nr:hypothetical protein [Variovorax sp. J22R133]MDM0114840.1 hypothetical protein [Variovorax sp. J22R133]
MAISGSQALIVGGVLSAAAAVAHLACIFLGAPAYRFMGAGEKMARAVEARKLRPAFVTLFIAAVLFIWAAYALAGAGVIRGLPLAKLVLPAICAVYLLRAVAFPVLRPAFPENSRTFWLVSSGICLVIGLVHVYGVVLRWSVL